jgi:hypothetical protein
MSRKDSVEIAGASSRRSSADSLHVSDTLDISDLEHSMAGLEVTSSTASILAHPSAFDMHSSKSLHRSEPTAGQSMDFDFDCCGDGSVAGGETS